MSGCEQCFNPRARAGRDVKPVLMLRVKAKFQSTRPRGARPIEETAFIIDQFVSIHAPARGATGVGHGKRRVDQFQSTRPRGARRASDGIACEPKVFQSTRPRGARLDGEAIVL